jgi:hypothetical protein
MALDDVLFDVLVEEAVDCVEYLRLGDALAAVDDEMFEDAPFAPRQRKGVALDLGIAAIEENLHFADDRRLLLHGRCAALDCADAGKNFSDMHGLAHNIVDAGREKIERLLEGVHFVHRDHRSA